MIGSGERSRTKRSPSMSCGGERLLDELDAVAPRAARSCRARAWASTPRSRRRAGSCPAPPRESTRMISSSSIVPSLTLSSGYSAASCTFDPQLVLSGAMPIVKLVSGASAGSSPHELVQRHAEALAHEIVAARRITALLAAPLPRHMRVHLELDRVERPRVRASRESAANWSSTADDGVRDSRRSSGSESPRPRRPRHPRR